MLVGDVRQEFSFLFLKGTKKEGQEEVGQWPDQKRCVNKAGHIIIGQCQLMQFHVNISIYNNNNNKNSNNNNNKIFPYLGLFKMLE